MAGIGQAASIADVQALEDLLEGLDEITRAMVERALDHRDEKDDHSCCVDRDDHEEIVTERDDLRIDVANLEDDKAELEKRIIDLEREISKLKAA